MLLSCHRSVAGTRAPGLVRWPTRSGSRLADTPPRWARAPALRPPAGTPRPHLLPLPHPRGRAHRSAARLPGSRRAAATAAPAPRRAHGARKPHFLSPKSRPADHSPGQSPAAAAVRGKAWRWDRPARSTAQRKRAGPGQQKTDARARDARPELRSSRAQASLPLGRADGSGEAAARDLRELECARQGAGEARTAAPGRRGGGAPLLFLII